MPKKQLALLFVCSLVSVTIGMGLESGSPKVLAAIKKTGMITIIMIAMALKRRLRSASAMGPLGSSTGPSMTLQPPQSSATSTNGNAKLR